MNAADEAKIILLSTAFLWPEKDDLISWADRRIGQSDSPEDWLIELSTLRSPRLADYLSALERNASGLRLQSNEKVLMAIDAYQSEQRDLRYTLASLSSIWLGRDDDGTIVQLDDHLADVLAWYDQVCDRTQDLPDDLTAAAERTFHRFRADHPDLVNPMPNLLNKWGQQDAGGKGV